MITVFTSAAIAANDPAIPSSGASLLAWTPAQQAWGYRHMEKVFPVKVIARGSEAHPLPVADKLIDPTFASHGKTYDTAAYMAAPRSAPRACSSSRMATSSLERYEDGADT